MSKLWGLPISLWVPLPHPTSGGLLEIPCGEPLLCQGSSVLGWGVDPISGPESISGSRWGVTAEGNSPCCLSFPLCKMGLAVQAVLSSLALQWKGLGAQGAGGRPGRSYSFILDVPMPVPPPHSRGEVDLGGGH